jgi:hypothetical protein
VEDPDADVESAPVDQSDRSADVESAPVDQSDRV